MFILLCGACCCYCRVAIICRAVLILYTTDSSLCPQFLDLWREYWREASYFRCMSGAKVSHQLCPISNLRSQPTGVSTMIFQARVLMGCCCPMWCIILSQNKTFQEIEVYNFIIDSKIFKNKASFIAKSMYNRKFHM